MTRRCALAHAVGTSQTDLQVKFHGIHLQALHAGARRAKWPVFTPPAAGLRISEIPDSDYAKSRTAVSVIPGQLGHG